MTFSDNMQIKKESSKYENIRKFQNICRMRRMYHFIVVLLTDTEMSK